MKSENFNNTIFKILALYIITSGVFLTIFFITFYQKEANYIRLNQITHSYTHYNYILQNIIEARHDKNLLNKDDFSYISKKINTQFAIVANNQIIFSNLTFDALKILTQLKENNFIYNENKRLFIDFSRIRNLNTYIDTSNLRKPKHHSHFLRHKNIHIIIETEDLGFKKEQYRKDNYNNLDINDYANELWKLKLKTIFYTLICILLLAIIAYILILLVFKNIKEQFKTLNDFIKDTTHEINTPLSVILASIKKFDDTNLNPNNTKKLNHIKLASKNLNHIYQNLIALNFFLQKENTKEDINLKELLEQRLEYFDTLISQKNLIIEKELLEQNFYANKEEMQILLDNLLSNAIKYTNTNKKIFICLKEKTLSIKDEGQGMSAKEITQIFTRYKRFNQDQGGFGIGLNLVKQIADKNNINIKVLSKKDKGSEFILSW
ncbi:MULTISPECIES: sensor histidine kinase [unclassified Campylobacter]|uniref:sensor histidine kinase n=1 Tax=unclassified Campylobacter TaxID=2593542 RepID=UPI0012C13337|nr:MULTISPECIES: HAMP domain-containing sensor histidine kinase [unclassified Campylobacter]EAI4447332.1 HAMP domain-containing histidine kinase [Campylobacter lari]EAK5534204.1 HAMP domain-containing histidine kinase [Campylobacter lari]EAK9882338.1 HAMP domain-containing histidine kinase [Campylobacter lari]EFB0440560.1 HAMP domain-containing histidine kinase [Campylobacter lari]MCV3356241.1 HAMP domain-containing histidine kinase [Campylobacter sp. RKI_CA19_01122]